MTPRQSIQHNTYR